MQVKAIHADIFQPTLIKMSDNEGDGVVNWSPNCGVNKTLSDIFTLTFFECPITLEASYVLSCTKQC